MKKLIVAALIVSLVPTVAVANPPRTPKPTQAQIDAAK